MNLQEIQAQLKAPKNQYNNFGKYKYRSCEDILEAVKPLLGDSVLTLSDEIKSVNTVMALSVYAKAKEPEQTMYQSVTIAYIEATATLRESSGAAFIVKAQAGVKDSKLMDISQAFGAASSYARKYALNGLFLIDDTKDADTTNIGGNVPETKPEPKITELQVKLLNARISKLGIDREKFKSFYGVKSLSETTKDLFKNMIDALDRKESEAKSE